MTRSDAVQRVAVLGCGFIGFSWAVVFSRHGIAVRMYDTNAASREAVRGRVQRGLEFLRDEGVIDDKAVLESLGRVTVFDDLAAAVEGAEYVQEALPEDLRLKQETFARVAEMLDPDVVVGSSASGLLRADIVAEVREHPERCIVAHPTNPPHLIPFMEIVGDDADPEALDWAFRFMTGVGQRPVRCKEVYGYVLNRLQLALIQEALYLVQQDICNVEGVESAITDGLGLRWAFTGPYGVEELNSADLAEGLGKYRQYMLEGFKCLGRVGEYDEDFIDKAVDGFSRVMSGMNHEEYLAWRDRMVMRTRMLKAQSTA